MNEHIHCLAVIAIAIESVAIPCLVAWWVGWRLNNPFVTAGGVSPEKQMGNTRITGPSNRKARPVTLSTLNPRLVK